MQTVSIDKLLDSIMKLDFYSREMLMEILKKRQIEESRKAILQNAKKARAELQKGKLTSQAAREVIAQLNAF